MMSQGKTVTFKHKPYEADILPHSGGKYVITKYLAQGGCGNVYTVKQFQNTENSPIYILKKLKKSLRHAEIDALKKVRHLRDTVTIRDYDFNQGLILMEYGGENYIEVFDYISHHIHVYNRELPTDDFSFRFFLKIANAVNDMKEVGVYHGDLSTSNVMVHKHRPLDEPLQIIDFGHSESLEGHMYSKLSRFRPCEMNPDHIDHDILHSENLFTMEEVSTWQVAALLYFFTHGHYIQRDEDDILKSTRERGKTQYCIHMLTTTDVKRARELTQFIRTDNHIGTWLKTKRFIEYREYI